MFTDRVQLHLSAGKGGNGVVAWRREKYLPKGGPYGGNGGKGGSILVRADRQIPSLDAYRHRRLLKAENGQQGGSNNRRGRNGRDLIVKVPCGTLVKDAKTGQVLYDLTEDGEEFALCRGGKGGMGNTFFKSSTNRAPNQATPGKPGESCHVELELKLIADVGLVGFPNAGKSTLMSAATDIPVKMAPYPFTTLRPNLGYILDGQSRVLLADIPGIIAGAHENRGLGLEFLRHIERTQLLVFVIDLSGIDGRDPLEDYAVLLHELQAYNPELLKKPFHVVLNKIDEAPEQVEAFAARYPDTEICPLSALTGQGVEDWVALLKRKLSR